MEGLEGEKEAAASAAVHELKDPRRIALGTGSTAAWAVRKLAERFGASPSGIEFVSSSSTTELLARELGLPVRPLRGDDRFDVMLDGADEVTPQLDLLKGGGGALLREKLLARRSAALWILVDHTKLVHQLGEKSPIPLEVVPFAEPVVAEEVAALGFAPKLRAHPATGQPIQTDNGNYVLDLTPPAPIEDPAKTDEILHSVTGVIETGIFAGFQPTVFVARPDGSVERRETSAP